MKMFENYKIQIYESERQEKETLQILLFQEMFKNIDQCFEASMLIIKTWLKEVFLTKSSLFFNFFFETLNFMYFVQ